MGFTIVSGLKMKLRICISLKLVIFPVLKLIIVAHRVYRVMLPLRNGPNKRVVFSNTTICSGKKLICRFSKKAWPFAK